MTSACSFRDFEFNGSFYRVIDTPGLQDTNLGPEELQDRLRNFADFSPNGVDAFLFVVRRGRFRPEYAEAFKAFEEACTTEVLKHTILLFTCLDDENNVDFRQSLESEDIPSLQDCLQKVCGRAVGVENKVGGKERQLEDQALVLSYVETVRDENKTPYNNEHLQEANKWRKAVESKAKELELDTNQQTVLKLLQDLFYGRCERSDVSKKLSALIRSERQFKARDVVDAMAVMGQVREVCERLIFESKQLPDRCGKETCIPMDRFCSGHRECNRPGYNNNGSNHPCNCSLYPWWTSPGQVAASQCCKSDQVRGLKQNLLDESSTMQDYASKEFLLQELQHLTPAATYEKLAAALALSYKRIEACCATLATSCPEKLTFHIVLDFQRTVSETCGKRFREEFIRIQEASGRIAKFAKHLESLAQEVKEAKACYIQAAFRGQVARRIVAKLRLSVARTSQSDGQGDATEEEAGEQRATLQEDAIDPDAATQAAEAGGGESQTLSLQRARKRPTRRGGMNKRWQQTADTDTMSIPATDDGFD